MNRLGGAVRDVVQKTPQFGSPWSGPTSGLVSQWWLDDSHVSGTTITDSGSNNNTGTAHGGITSTSSPSGAFYSTARAFDGTGYITASVIPEFGFPNDFTWAAWVNLTDVTVPGSNGTRATFLASADGSTYDVRVLNTDNAGTFEFSILRLANPGGLKTPSVVMANGTWMHAAFTFLQSGPTQTLYINGSSVAGVVQEDDSSAVGVAVIGSIDSGGASGDITGKMYNIVLYNRTLSSGEITTLYNAK